MKAPLKKRIFYCTLLLVPLFFFQNCAGPLDLDDSEISDLASSVPHAFEFQADTISYMSCDAGNTTDDSLFTFKVGAYNDGSGVKLKESYIEALGNSKERSRIEALVDSPVNEDAVLQLSLRDSLFQIFASTTANEGIDFDNFFFNLTTQNIVESLHDLDASSSLNYFNQGVAGIPGIAPEGLIRFNSSYNAAVAVREQLGSGIDLVLGYGDELTQDSSLRDTTEGSAFSVNFTLGRGMALIEGGVQNNFLSTFRGEATKVLSSVNERVLDTTNSNASGQWVCPERLRFVIAKPSTDGTDNLCGRVSLNLDDGYIQDSVTSPAGAPNVNQRYASEAEYHAVRSILPADEWTIDLGRRCVVPKDPDSADRCYSDAGFNPTANPDRNINYTALDGLGSCGSGPNNTHGCPHYVSICIRNGAP